MSKQADEVLNWISAVLLGLVPACSGEEIMMSKKSIRFKNNGWLVKPDN